MNTAALVVNWNTPSDLYRCVMSAEQHDPGLVWAVFQNDHPPTRKQSELTAQLLNDALGPKRFFLLTSKENKGHGFGINRLAELGLPKRPEFLFIVNPDVVWTEPVVERLEAFLDGDDNRGVVGPKQMDSKNRITAAGIVGTGDKPAHRYWHRHDPKNLLARDLVEGPTVAGSALFTRRDYFFGIQRRKHNRPVSTWVSTDGCFDWGFLEAKHYYSETWYCYHLRAHGYTVWYWGEPWMIHEWHQSSPVGFRGTDGMFSHDREMFRSYCDRHDPPILYD